MPKLLGKSKQKHSTFYVRNFSNNKKSFDVFTYMNLNISLVSLLRRQQSENGLYFSLFSTFERQTFSTFPPISLISDFLHVLSLSVDDAKAISILIIIASRETEKKTCHTAEIEQLGSEFQWISLLLLFFCATIESRCPAWSLGNIVPGNAGTFVSMYGRTRRLADSPLLFGTSWIRAHCYRNCEGKNPKDRKMCHNKWRKIKASN